MPYVGADALDLLRALVLEVRELRAMLEADRAGVASGADAALIAAIYAVAGLRPFRAQELISMARRPGAPELALRVLLGERSPKRVGKLLAGAAGRPCSHSGLVLTAQPNRLGTIWRISHARTGAAG